MTESIENKLNERLQEKNEEIDLLKKSFQEEQEALKNNYALEMNALNDKLHLDFSTKLNSKVNHITKIEKQLEELVNFQQQKEQEQVQLESKLKQKDETYAEQVSMLQTKYEQKLSK